MVGAICYTLWLGDHKIALEKRRRYTSLLHCESQWTRLPTVGTIRFVIGDRNDTSAFIIYLHH